MLIEKRTAYGDNLTSGAAFIRILFPDGIPESAYEHLLIVVRILDKLFRWANQCKLIDAGANWRDVEMPFEDIAGYGIAMMVNKKMKEADDFGESMQGFTGIEAYKKYPGLLATLTKEDAQEILDSIRAQ